MSARPKVILHQFPQSHFCIRIRWALALKGVAFETRDYRLATLDELTKVTGGYRRVPVLQWEDRVACDSPAIARFIEDNASEGPTLYPDGAPPALCDIVNGWADGRVMLIAAKWLAKDYLAFLGNDEDRALYRKVFRSIHGVEPEEVFARKASLELEMLAQWSLLEQALTGRPYLLGDRLSYADLGVASRLRLMQMAGRYELPEAFPLARKWFAGIAKLAA